MNLEELVQAYLSIRFEREKLLADYEQKDKALKDDMAVLEQNMLAICNDASADSIKTPHGTIIRSVKTRYWTSDWESMHDFVLTHKAFDLLERRVHQTNMKQWLEENPDLLPMGLNSEARYSTTVRRSK